MIFLTKSNARQVNSILGSNSLSEVKKAEKATLVDIMKLTLRTVQ